MDFFSGANNIIGIATILGTIAAWIALYPIVQPYLLKLTGKTIPVDEFETSYLISLEKDLETKNQNNRWSNKFYVNVDVELQERKRLYEIPPSFYVVKAINRHLKDQDFNNLSNVEKIDSSRGQTFRSLQSAIDEAQDNAVVVISPPGNGKTVSLRNLAVKKIKQRLAGQSNIIPIFINLGYYTGFNSDGTIQEFASFLENFFGSTGYYRYLSNGYWETLLRQSRCIFLLDGIDELPRKSEEYETRSKIIAEFVRAWPNTQFILSCRELDYNRELAFQQILIKPFDRNHIRSYLRKYISQNEYKTIVRQIEDSSGIYELCTNPFYLDLVSYFSKFNKKIPDNKAQLFDFIIDKFIERENAKSDTLIARQDFILAISNLAYHLAIKKMITTINIEDYIQSLKNHPDQQMFVKMIYLAIQGGLLEFNEQSREIRFIHNRFQEFFSSHYILRNYRKDNKCFPDNFFTNIWWKETVLFVAGLDNKVDDLITKILSYRDKQLLGQNLLGKLLKVEITSLAFESIFANLSFDNEHLYIKIRDELFQEYHAGDTIVKAIVLNAFRHDKSEKVLAFLEAALDDKSLWVSERAFFLLTDEQVRFQLTPKGILREFWKFFLEGKLINIFIPLWKSTAKSRLIRAFFPIYLLLVITSILSIPLVGYVFYSFAEFIIFKLDLAFTAECIGCLFTISLGVFIIIYALTKNNYPILKRFISVVPLAFLIRYLVFNIPSSFIYKLIMLAVGVLFFSLYGSYLKKPNESDYSPGSITAFILGYSIPIPILNFKAFAAMFDFDIFNSSQWTHLGNIKTTMDLAQPYIMAVLLLASIVGLSIYIYREAQIVRKLNIYSKYIQTNLSTESFDDSQKLAIVLLQMLESLSIIWAQEVLLKRIIERMTVNLSLTREYKIIFLHSLARNTEDIYLSDKIYQYIEDEQNNLRRTINSRTMRSISQIEQEPSANKVMDKNTLASVATFSIIDQAKLYQIDTVHSVILKIFSLFGLWRQESLALEKIISNLLHTKVGAENNDAIMTAVNRIVVIYMKKKKYSESLAKLNIILKIDSKNTWAINRRGICFMQLGQYQEAIDVFFELSRIKSEMSNLAYYNIACVYALQNDVEKSCHWLRKSVKINRDWLKSARKDEDFDKVRKSKEFKDLLIELSREH